MRKFKFAFVASVHCMVWLLPVLFFEMVDEVKFLGVFSTAQFTLFYPLYYGIAFGAAYFYICVYWLMPYLLKKRNVWLVLAGTVLAHILHSILESFVDFAVVRANFLISETVTFLDVLIANLILNIFLWLITIVYFFITRLIISERNKSRLREEKLQMELDFLKSQINPHFVFNVLNNLFGTARKNNDNETADGIIQLSGLMRYMIYETNENEVFLENEVEYLQTYIKLQEKRFTPEDNIKIVFEINGTLRNHKIAPMLFIPFVENAFKYGISLEYPSFINIRLNSMGSNIDFSVHNSRNFRSKRQAGSGLGLKNTKKRLELIYGTRHELEICEKPKEFLINLKLSNLV